MPPPSAARLTHPPAAPPSPPAAQRDRFLAYGLRADDAAEYVGVSTTTFRQWVADGVMPQPRRRGGVAVWGREDLEKAFDRLPTIAPTTTAADATTAATDADADPKAVNDISPPNPCRNSWDD